MWRGARGSLLRTEPHIPVLVDERLLPLNRCYRPLLRRRLNIELGCEKAPLPLNIG
jgi:hypothetical protein